MRTSFKMASLAVLTVALVGCNVSQDGSGKDTRVGMNGLAVDGRVANALVWVDRNNNFEWDRDFEPSARTDTQGYFSYNPEQSIDYCSLSESDSRARHCLLYGSSEETAVIRVSGGVDISTGERLKGVMAHKTTQSAASRKSIDLQLTSPITSLLSEADAAQRVRIEGALELTGAYERINFVGDDLEAQELKMLANAVSIQSMQDLLGAMADDSEAGESRSSHDLSERCVGFKSIPREVLCGLSSHVAEIQLSPTRWESDDLDGIMKLTRVPEGDGQDRLKQNLQRVQAAARRIEESENSQQITARVRAVEVVHQLARKSSVDNDPGANTRLGSLDDDAAKLELENALGANSDGSGGEDFDLKGLSDSLAENPTQNVETAATNAKLGALSEINQWLVLQVDPDDQEDAEEVKSGSYIALYLGGDDNGGTVAACAYARPDDDDVGDGDESVLKHEYVSGNWSRISDGRVTLSLKYKRFEREGQLIARAVAEDDVNKFRLTAFDDDGVQQEGFAVANAQAIEALNTGSPFARPSNTNNNCSALHEVVAEVEGIGWE